MLIINIWTFMAISAKRRRRVSASLRCIQQVLSFSKSWIKSLTTINAQKKLPTLWECRITAKSYSKAVLPSGVIMI